MSILCTIAKVVKFCEKTLFFLYFTKNFIIPIIKCPIFAVTTAVV